MHALTYSSPHGWLWSAYNKIIIANSISLCQTNLKLLIMYSPISYTSLVIIAFYSNIMKFHSSRNTNTATNNSNMITSKPYQLGPTSNNSSNWRTIHSNIIILMAEHLLLF
ncbi:hypothetical protein J0S82_002269 [Galemys pyrenaicus]|uniref:Uncharacterized protein n=1 Tax=Galemys pyrenaicus TaxID=202257 RepID=A0A8J5ZTV4_GALPY|nr:hypothetical protein J0S82_002269 [Galemys pyrenaicus]